MALTDAVLIEQHTGVSATVAARVAESCLEAGLYLVSLKGADWYNERIGWAENNPAPDADQAALLTLARKAESLLAYYYALPLLNLRVQDSGGVAVVEWETDAENNRVQTAFASTDSIAAVRVQILRQAKLLVQGDVRIGYDSDSPLIDGATDAVVTEVALPDGAFTIGSV